MLNGIEEKGDKWVVEWNWRRGRIGKLLDVIEEGEDKWVVELN